MKCIKIFTSGALASLVICFFHVKCNSQPHRLLIKDSLVFNGVHVKDTKLKLIELAKGHLITNGMYRSWIFDESLAISKDFLFKFTMKLWNDSVYTIDHFDFATLHSFKDSLLLSHKEQLVNIHTTEGKPIAGLILKSKGLNPSDEPLDSSGFGAWPSSNKLLISDNNLYLGIRRSKKYEARGGLNETIDTLILELKEKYGTYSDFPLIIRYCLPKAIMYNEKEVPFIDLMPIKVFGRQGDHFFTAFKRGFYREPSPKHVYLAWDGRRQRILTAPINHHHITAYDTSGTEVARFGQRGRHLRQPYFEGIPAALFDSLARTVRSSDSLFRLLDWFNTCSAHLPESYFDLHLDQARGLAYRLYQEPVLERPMSELIPYAFLSRAKLYALLRKDPSLFLQVYDLATGELIFDEPVPTPRFILSFIDPQGILWAVTGVDETAITVGRFRLVQDGH